MNWTEFHWLDEICPFSWKSYCNGSFHSCIHTTVDAKTIAWTNITLVKQSFYCRHWVGAWKVRWLPNSSSYNRIVVWNNLEFAFRRPFGVPLISVYLGFLRLFFWNWPLCRWWNVVRTPAAREYELLSSFAFLMYCPFSLSPQHSPRSWIEANFQKRDCVKFIPSPKDDTK